LLYQICRNQGSVAATEALLRRIVALHPNIFLAISDLTLLTLSKGAVLEAEHHAATPSASRRKIRKRTI